MRFFLLVLSLLSTHSWADYRLHYKIQGKTKTLVGAQKSKVLLDPSSDKKLLRRLPYYLSEGAGNDLEYIYEEWLVNDRKLPLDAQKFLALKTMFLPSGSEMRKLIEQGPVKNRINLSITGDGYTLAQKDKFFADAQRTFDGLFQGQTFQSYLPLFNVYAIFVPSAVSGIGDGSPKNTAFRLYRNPAGSKRAIMPGNEAALENALSLAPATDYPIVIANDDFYGGLGGRWAISTSSERTGLVVLRHELGHNFGEVGEEYDNGQVYAGANSSRSAQNLPWKHWVEGTTEVHEATLLSGNYVWKNLKTGAYTDSFRTKDQKSFFVLELSSVGWKTQDDVEVTLNSEKLSLEGTFHEDRSFFYFKPKEVAANTQYSLKIQEKIPDGDNVLGFAVAYSAPLSYNFTENHVGAYASYNTWGGKSYRPTHQSCIMRDMRRESFCVVDQENMWKKFLARVKLIDALHLKASGGSREVKLETQELPGLEISWFEINASQETEILELRGIKTWTPQSAGKKYKVQVRFRTPEVRLYDENFSQVQFFSI